MIEVTRLNNTPIIINCEQIECIEETPDTTITMISSRKYIVKETADTVVKKAVEFKRKILL